MQRHIGRLQFAFFSHPTWLLAASLLCIGFLPKVGKTMQNEGFCTWAAVAMKFGVLWSNTTVVSGLQATVAGDSLLVSSSVRERTLHSLSEKQNKAMRMNVHRAYFNIEGQHLEAKRDPRGPSQTCSPGVVLLRV